MRAIGRNKKRLLWFIFFALLTGCVKEQNKSPIVAKVGDATLRLDELRLSIPPELAKNLSRKTLQDYVNRWINAQILYQQGVKLGLADDPRLKKRVRDYEITLVGNAYLDRSLRFRPLVADSAIITYYEEHKNDFIRDVDAMHLLHILVKSKSTADSLYNLLRRGIAFDTLAMQMAKKSGGSTEWDLGYVSEDELVPDIAKVVRAYRLGRFTQPIKSLYGYHLFKILDKKSKGELLELDDVKHIIIARLENEKRSEEYRKLLGLLKSNAKIETNFQLLNTIPIDSLVHHIETSDTNSE